MSTLHRLLDENVAYPPHEPRTESPTYDLRPHRVTDTMSRRVDEELIVVDGRRMTANHPVLTPAGWLPAVELAPGDVALHVGMGAAEMLGLAGEEFEIQQPIVGAIPVDVMNALGRGEPSTDVLLHHEAMLHRRPSFVAIPNRHADVASGSERVTERLRHSLARERIERCESAGIGAEALTVGRSLDLVAASLADDGAGVDALGLRPTQAAALARTGGVAVGDLRDDQEQVPADYAGSLHSRAGAACARWRPISDVRRVTFSGRVHDISVSSCRSFVTDGLVVHNCAIHHRAKYEGIHEISYPAWLLQRYQGADWTFIAQHIESHTVTAHTPLIQPSQK